MSKKHKNPLSFHTPPPPPLPKSSGSGLETAERLVAQIVRVAIEEANYLTASMVAKEHELEEATRQIQLEVASVGQWQKRLEEKERELVAVKEAQTDAASEAESHLLRAKRELREALQGQEDLRQSLDVTRNHARTMEQERDNLAKAFNEEKELTDSLVKAVDEARQQRDTLAGEVNECQRAIHLLKQEAKGWRFPQAGEQVKLVKGYANQPAAVAVGAVYVVKGNTGVCVPVPEAEQKEFNAWAKYTFPAVHTEINGVLYCLPLSCCEPFV